RQLSRVTTVEHHARQPVQVLVFIEDEFGRREVVGRTHVLRQHEHAVAAISAADRHYAWILQRPHFVLTGRELHRAGREIERDRHDQRVLCSSGRGRDQQRGERDRPDYQFLYSVPHKFLTSFTSPL